MSTDTMKASNDRLKRSQDENLDSWLARKIKKNNDVLNVTLIQLSLVILFAGILNELVNRDLHNIFVCAYCAVLIILPSEFITKTATRQLKRYIKEIHFGISAHCAQSMELISVNDKILTHELMSLQAEELTPKARGHLEKAISTLSMRKTIVNEELQTLQHKISSSDPYLDLPPASEASS